MSNDMQDYLVEVTGGKQVIEVLYPDSIPAKSVNPPDCELGVVLVEIFGPFPHTG